MTYVFHSVAEWRRIQAGLDPCTRIGFVPTMGHLHQGHLSLCARSQAENDVTVVSIFVNPTQFNDAEDLRQYPRNVADDLQLLNEQAVDYCFLPDVDELYADDYAYQVSEQRYSNQLEGPIRPGHFTGMLTVVMKLLLAVSATRAYFGAKDYQQYHLIQAMVKSFFLPTEIILCPTIRETSGLPYSSRNSRLSSEEKELAARVVSIFLQKDLNLAEIRAKLNDMSIQIDYLVEQDERRFLAFVIGSIRILDNYALI